MDLNISKQIIKTTKKAVKQHHTSKNPVIKLGVSSLYVLWHAGQTAKRIYMDKDYRSILFLQWFNSKNVHQTTPFTYMDRYPTIFSACRDYFQGRENLKILSYGCSTGEEVLTLRKYFPTAHIVGADINKHSLSMCKKLLVDEKVTFIYSSPHEIQKHGPFDAIFCMAVLQRQPHYIAEKGISNLKKIYPFEKFERQIIELDQYVKPNGMLVVHFAQYSLEDTIVSAKYQAWGDYNQDNYSSPVFDKNSDLIKIPTSMRSIFVKSDR